MESQSLMFHHIHDYSGLYPDSQGSIDTSTLIKVIEQHQSQFNIVNPEDFCREIDKAIPNKAAAITFDDGLKSQAALASKKLNDIGMKGFFFVNTAYLANKNIIMPEHIRHFKNSYFESVDQYNKLMIQMAYDMFLDARECIDSREWLTYLNNFPYYSESDRCYRFLRDNILNKKRYLTLFAKLIDIHGLNLEELSSGILMDENDIRNLKENGHSIGCHSHSHPTNMNSRSREEVFYEYETNASILKSILGERPNSVSYPCGQNCKQFTSILIDIGFKFGFVNTYHKQELSTADWRLNLPRIDHSLVLKSNK